MKTNLKIIQKTKHTQSGVYNAALELYDKIMNRQISLAEADKALKALTVANVAYISSGRFRDSETDQPMIELHD